MLVLGGAGAKPSGLMAGLLDIHAEKEEQEATGPEAPADAHVVVFCIDWSTKTVRGVATAPLPFPDPDQLAVSAEKRIAVASSGSRAVVQLQWEQDKLSAADAPPFEAAGEQGRVKGLVFAASTLLALTGDRAPALFSGRTATFDNLRIVQVATAASDASSAPATAAAGDAVAELRRDFDDFRADVTRRLTGMEAMLQQVLAAVQQPRSQ